MKVTPFLVSLFVVVCASFGETRNKTDGTRLRVAFSYEQYDPYDDEYRDFHGGGHSGLRNGFSVFEGTMRRTHFREVCVGETLVAVGECSHVYIVCDYTHFEYEVQLCQPTQVFSGGYCVHMDERCSNRRMEQINTDTERLLQGVNFCAQGEGIYVEGRGHCSRQGVVCTSQRRVYAVYCSQEKTMSSQLRCIPSSSECAADNIPFDDFAPIKAAALNWHCGRELATHDHSSAHRDRQQCTSWYVDCHSSRRQMISCDYGLIYDHERRRCRRVSSKDQCRNSLSCSGREWQDISESKCGTTFLRCEGGEARRFECADDLVFFGGHCVRPSETNGICDSCIDGTTKKSSFNDCSQYSKCQSGRWRKRQCPSGQGFSTDLGQCVANLPCPRPQRQCHPGTSARISCSEYMECTWTRHFEWKSCPPFHTWDTNARRCVYDRNCSPSKERGKGQKQCREGEVVETSNCVFYHQCVNGRWQRELCGERFFSREGCSECDNEKYRKWAQNGWECREGAFRRHDRDCSVFARCVNGRWVRDECPTGMSFDERTRACSRRGECNPFRESDCEDGERVQLYDRTRCSEYFQCVSGIWTTFFCPDGQMFDATKEGCVQLIGPCPFSDGSVAHPVRTGQRHGSASLSAALPFPHFAEHGFANHGAPCKVGAVVKDDFDCSRYYSCTDEGYVLSTCDRGSQFNPTRGTCDKKYRCDFSRCDDGESRPGHICGAYEMCRRGQWIEEMCENNQRFVSGRCEGSCGSRRGSGELPYPDQCTNGHAIADEKDCTLYLACKDGRYYQRQCARGGFDPNVGLCLVDYECPEGRRPGCYEDDVKADNEDCRAYHRCIGGIYEKKWCPSGEGFSVHTSSCVPKGCPAAGGGVESETCTEDGGPRGYRADPHNCRKFYQCAHGKWVHKDCPANLAWNTRATTCDYPKNVPGCGPK